MNSNTRLGSCTEMKLKMVCQTVAASAFVVVFTVGCSTKNYVRSQVNPLVQQTNELDAKTAQDHRDITDTDARAQTGIAKANDAASSLALGAPRVPTTATQRDSTIGS